MKEAVARALAYLETNGDRRLGGKALIGLAFLKAGTERNHPRVQEAIEAVVAAASSRNTVRPTKEVYHTALAIVFLAALDSNKYRPAIKTYLDRLLNLQKPHGGWGYKETPVGDTSMTQMAVLALFEARRAGVRVPSTPWSAVTNWLLRTQDPSGGFGYHPTDPGNFTLRNQRGVRISLTAGALGSLYILEAPTGASAPSQPQPSGRRWRQAIERGEDWMRKNWKVASAPYLHYYLYALERYETYRTLAGDSPSPEDWYSQGAEMLIQTQAEDGSWHSVSVTPAVDTAFAVLFLVRSTKQGVDITDTLGSGMLVGGRGVPSNTTNVRLRDGKLVGPKFSASTERLLSLMEDPSGPDYLAAAEAFKEAALQFDAQTLSPHVERLQKLVEGKDAKARAVAIRVLARRRNFDDVPMLIAALQDSDAEVVMAARDGLRFVSRRLQGFGLSDNPNERQWREAVANWKGWYRSLRPDANLEN